MSWSAKATTPAKRIAIFGQYKSGTTALCSAIKAALPETTRTLYEPRQYVPQRRDRKHPILAKVILGTPENGHSVDYQSFLEFEKKIYLIRDPRDWSVSGTLFLIQQEPAVYANSTRLNRILSLLKQKESDPQSIALGTILEEVLHSLPGHSLTKTRQWLERQIAWLFAFEARLGDHCRIKYEDFIDGKTAALEEYLGFILTQDPQVDAAHNHVTRTKGYGNWKDWFVSQDVAYFRPVFEPYIRRYAYDPSWQLNPQPVIRAEHCSQYVERTVGKRRDPLREQYRIEKRLARRLRAAGRAERVQLYQQSYEEFSFLLPSERKAALQPSLQAQQKQTQLLTQLVEAFLTKSTTVLEIGSGNNALALRLCPLVRQVYAVDVMPASIQESEPPGNFQLIVSAGPSYALPAASIDLALSCHFIEHLHPEDAAEHIREVQRLLAPGGHYVCITPNRLFGPHDISGRFGDAEACGLHLQEYSYTTLAALFQHSGFSPIHALHGRSRPPVCWPLWPYALAERILEQIPRVVRQTAFRLFQRSAPLRPLEQVVLVVTKK